MKNRNIGLVDLDESAMACYIKRLTGAPADRVHCERAALRSFLAYLRADAIVRSPALRGQSAIAQIYSRYLARLGLRAGEVVALELGDVRWRTGELVVHGKGQMVEHVPLPS